MGGAKRGKHSKQTFVMLRHDMMRSEAYQSLRPADRVVYHEVLGRYNGFNNGFIQLACREAAILCNISKTTASRAFDALIERGFIKVGKDSVFNMKNHHSREWIITHETLSANIAPTNEWKEWKRKN